MRSESVGQEVSDSLKPSNIGLCTGGTARIRAVVIAALLLALVAPAAAQSATQPELRPGDQWSFAAFYTVPSTTPNRLWRITGISPAGIEGTENGEPLLLTHDLNVMDSPRVRESNPRLLSFPLVVGKRWEYESNWEFKPKGSKGHYRVTVVVVAYEKVSVPAGEFEAFKLLAREALSGTSPIGTAYSGEATRTYWYAPSARAVVKSISHNPYLGSSEVQLVSMELRP